MVTAYLAAGLSRHFSPAALLVAFALLMLVVGALMLLRRDRQGEAIQQRPWWIALLAGAGVGVLTGVLGVGGGFLIVPALVMLVGPPIYQAVGRLSSSSPLTAWPALWAT